MQATYFIHNMSTLANDLQEQRPSTVHGKNVSGFFHNDEHQSLEFASIRPSFSKTVPMSVYGLSASTDPSL